MDKDKIKCTACNWHGYKKDMLVGINPFDKSDTITACPFCKSLDSTLSSVCDEPGCLDSVSCGWRSDNGYRNTCGNHYKDTA